jgi:hypothetical protein
MPPSRRLRFRYSNRKTKSHPSRLFNEGYPTLRDEVTVVKHTLDSLLLDDTEATSAKGILSRLTVLDTDKDHTLLHVSLALVARFFVDTHMHRGFTLEGCTKKSYLILVLTTEEALRDGGVEPEVQMY